MIDFFHPKKIVVECRAKDNKDPQDIQLYHRLEIKEAFVGATENNRLTACEKDLREKCHGL